MVTSTTRSVSVDEYKTFRQQGFLVVRGLLGPDEVEELREHTELLMQGRLPEQVGTMSERDTDSDSGTTGQALEAPPDPPLARTRRRSTSCGSTCCTASWSCTSGICSIPRVLDVLEALIGPDVLALQTHALPQAAGQAGAGLAPGLLLHPDPPGFALRGLDRDRRLRRVNGAMWMATGSQHEPVYPPKRRLRLRRRAARRTSSTSAGRATRTTRATISARIADRYPQLLVAARGRRCRLLRRARPPPQQEELHHRPLPARLRRPLLQRPLVHPVGREPRR